MMYDSVPRSAVQVKLDGIPVQIPAERRSLRSICALLESVALHQERILCSVVVDGESINLTEAPNRIKSFTSIEAETMSLNEVPTQLVTAALQQTASLRERTQSVLERVLINEDKHACELWWELSFALKEPILTLSLLPEGICGSGAGQASFAQLRKWQLQQLGAVIQDVNNACEWNGPVFLSDALELRVLPWLEKLHTSLSLWHETILADSRVASRKSSRGC